ncbi:21180_t:CDS:2 [Entrophospora sp. SA101]|nr:21180_t:CDS:2 [Entrophospora sp. SA101]
MRAEVKELIEILGGSVGYTKRETPDNIRDKKCYNKIYEKIQNEIQDGNKNENASLFFITGNPGIGKSYFGLHLLYQFAKLKKEIIYQHFNYPGRVFYFSSKEHKVFEGKTLDEFSRVLNLESTLHMVDDMIPSNYPAVKIVLTSPQKKKIKDDAKELYELCGGIAHYIFEWKKEEAYQEIDLAIKTCDLGKIIKSVGEVDAPHDTSHVIVHIVVDPQTFQRHKVQFASSIIREKIYQRFLNEQQFSLRNFLKACEDESITGGICGNLLEDFAHKMLKAGGKYEIKLLESEEELREGDTQKKKLKSNNGTSASLINELNLTVKGTFKFSKLEEITAKHQVIKHLNELQNEENETELYFVVPDEIYLTFNKQKFQTKPGKNAERTPPIIHSIKQYSLKIPLDVNMMIS